MDKNDRIPFDYWINSQLAVSRHYGGCKINGDDYICDYENCKTEMGDDGELKYFPDLVKVKKKK